MLSAPCCGHCVMRLRCGRELPVVRGAPAGGLTRGLPRCWLGGDPSARRHVLVRLGVRPQVAIRTQHRREPARSRADRRAVARRHRVDPRPRRPASAAQGPAVAQQRAGAARRDRPRDHPGRPGLTATAARRRAPTARTDTLQRERQRPVVHSSAADKRPLARWMRSRNAEA